MPRQVSFAAECTDTRMGLHVRVVGSCPALGKWVPFDGLPLVTSATDFPTWRTSSPASLPEDEIIEYKYVICDNSGAPVRWEERGNRNFHLASLAARNIFPEHGNIAVVEGFNINNDADQDRFRSESEGLCHVRRTYSGRDTSGAADQPPRKHSGVSRVSANSQIFEGMAPDAGASGDATDMFAPTIRERTASMSCLSGDGLIPVQALRSSSKSFLGGLSITSGGQGDPDASNVPEVTGDSGSIPQVQSDGGVADLGLVREESCSNLFLDNTIMDEDPVKDTSEFDDKYALVGNGPLGEGTFGLVWRCRPKGADVSDNKARAAKIVRKARLQPRDMRYLLGEDGEVRTHLTMQHPHIVRLFEYFDESNTVTLVLEYCAGGDLFDAIVKQSRARGGRGFAENEAALVTSHVLSALEYVHSQQVVHRDIKCENILLQDIDVPLEQNIFKLCDFGFAAHDRGEGLSDRLGSPDTVAPEVVVGTRYSTPADLWSAGVLIYMMLSATPPFYATTDCEVLRKVRTGSYSLSGDLWDSISHPPKAMISSLMVVDPKRRPTASEALHNEWLKTVPPP